MDISLAGRSCLGWPGHTSLADNRTRAAAASSQFSEELQNLREQAVAEKHPTAGISRDEVIGFDSRVSSAGADPSWFVEYTSPGTTLVTRTVKTQYLADFQKFMAAKEKQYWEAEKAAPPIDECPKLTDAQREYLSAAYKKENMTQAEYKALAKDLRDFGLLSEDDLLDLGFSEDILELTPLRWYGCGITHTSMISSKYSKSFEECGGNLQEWVKHRASYLRADQETGAYFKDRRALLYTRLYNVLQQIS